LAFATAANQHSGFGLCYCSKSTQRIWPLQLQQINTADLAFANAANRQSGFDIWGTATAAKLPDVCDLLHPLPLLK